MKYYGCGCILNWDGDQFGTNVGVTWFKIVYIFPAKKNVLTGKTS